MANRISQPHVDSERFAFAQAATSSARLWSNGPLVLTKSSAGELLVNDAIIEGRSSGRAIFRFLCKVSPSQGHQFIAHKGKTWRRQVKEIA